jgi:hypothetical protein
MLAVKGLSRVVPTFINQGVVATVKIPQSLFSSKVGDSPKTTDDLKALVGKISHNPEHGKLVASILDRIDLFESVGKSNRVFEDDMLVHIASSKLSPTEVREFFEAGYAIRSKRELSFSVLSKAVTSEVSKALSSADKSWESYGIGC